MPMKYPTVFHLVSNALQRAAVYCVLIGGFAVNYYKVTRQSADVDFLITQDGFKKISSFLIEEGYKIDYSQEVFARLKSNQHLGICALNTAQRSFIIRY